MSDSEALRNMAAKYKKMRQVMENLPFWRYLTVVDPSTRESHSSLW